MILPCELGTIPLLRWELISLESPSLQGRELEGGAWGDTGEIQKARGKQRPLPSGQTRSYHTCEDGQKVWVGPSIVFTPTLVPACPADNGPRAHLY